MTNKEITVQLADFIETTQISGIPDSVVQSAKPLIIDFLGVTTAGSVEEPSRIIQDFIREQGGRGDSTLIGTSIQSHAAWTSLANGIAGHALDFDDVSQPMYGHPTTAVLPACLAIGESLNVSGMALLEAYIIGLEVAVKLGYGMNPFHYKHGWHATCTLGSMGSAASAAKLLGLKGKTLRNALAVAASQAGGLQQNFGTMTKPFHAGRAAENGVLAALLAQKGWTGDQNILDSPLGFFNVFCGPGRYDGEKAVNRLGRPFDIEKPGIILKKFPSCAFSHPVIDAALIIFQDPAYDSHMVEEVEGEIGSLANQILIHWRPETGLEAKFSMEACAAMALLDGNVNSKSFTDERVRRNDMKEMMGRIERKIRPDDPEGSKDFGPATVKVRLKGGKILEAQVQKAKGNPDNPMSPEEIRQKYVDCCSGLLPEASIKKSLSLLEDLDGVKELRELMGLFRI